LVVCFEKFCRWGGVGGRNVVDRCSLVDGRGELVQGWCDALDDIADLGVGLDG
jgi:hypothetical protein